MTHSIGVSPLPRSEEKYNDGGVEFIIKGLKESDDDGKADEDTPDNVVKLPA